MYALPSRRPLPAGVSLAASSGFKHEWNLTMCLGTSCECRVRAPELGEKDRERLEQARKINMFKLKSTSNGHWIHSLKPGHTATSWIRTFVAWCIQPVFDSFFTVDAYHNASMARCTMSERVACSYCLAFYIIKRDTILLWWKKGCLLVCLFIWFLGQYAVQLRSSKD